MRAVFDTNIFVSAFVAPSGRAEEALLKAVHGNVRLLVSKPIIYELLAVLTRKFVYDKEELARIAVYLSDLGEMVRPRRKIRVLADEPDNRILECASAGNADIIVTGDKAMLRLDKYDGVKIITLKEFIESF